MKNDFTFDALLIIQLQVFSPMSASLSHNNPSFSKRFAFQQVSKLNPEKSQKQSLQGMIVESGIFQINDTSGFDFPNFPETRKQFKILYLNLSEEFEDIKGLIRGLISLGQPTGVVFQFEKELNRFNLKFYQHDEEIVYNYLSNIFNTLNEERRFKMVLRRIIEVEKSRKAEERFLYQELLA